MKVDLTFFKALALLSAAYAMFTLGLLFRTTQLQVRAVGEHSHEVLNKATESLGKMDTVATSLTVNLDKVGSAVDAHKALTVKTQKDLDGTFRNINAVLVQWGIASDQLAQASIEQREQLQKANGAIEKFQEAATALTDLAKDPSWKEIGKNVADGTKSGKDGVEEVRQAIHEMRNPPKKTRGGRIMEWIFRNIIGNAIQGAVRR